MSLKQTIKNSVPKIISCIALLVMKNTPKLYSRLLNNTTFRRIFYRLKLIKQNPAPSRLKRPTRTHPTILLSGPTECKKTAQLSHLYIDVSHIAQSDQQSGIQRVVKEIVRALYSTQRSDIKPIAVELRRGQLYVAHNWLHKQGLLPPNKLKRLSQPIIFRNGDILLMLDSSWSKHPEFYPVFESAYALEVPVITVIYDLLPIQLQKNNFTEGFILWFETWFRDAIQSSDGFICISKTVADEALAYLDQHKLHDVGPKYISHWHLGSNFSPYQGVNLNNKRHVPTPYLLMVGTLEPRKSHAIALDALEKLWAQKCELSLCIAGKEGWMSKELLERIHSHPYLNQKLFLIEGPTDTELRDLYANAVGLLSLSKGEGFGLPLIEAAQYGIPILCSDIAVFREVCGAHASYVNHNDGSLLADQIEDWWQRSSRNDLPDTRKIDRFTWKESADALLNVIMNSSWI